MELPDDVHAHLATAFAPGEVAQAIALLASARTEDGSAPTARLLRCAAFASNGQLPRLRHLVALMALDWRDVVTAGECDHVHGHPQHVRDFTQAMAIPHQESTAHDRR